MRRYFEEGVNMVLDGTVNTSEMITHIYPLERIQEAFQLRNDKGASNDAIHVMIDVIPNQDGSIKPIIRL
jgi:threonine dehydrogenase-like Zn-dependent dehydrogenase